MSETVKYNYGHGGQKFVKAPNAVKKPSNAGKKVEGTDLRVGTGSKK